MDMVTIYRIEDSERRGPYCGSNETCFTGKQIVAYADLLSIFYEPERHPNPKQDSRLNGIMPYEYCAFDSVGQLRDWFRGSGHILVECGFMVNAYSVPVSSVRFGERQCLVTDLPEYSPTHTFVASAIL